MRKHRGLSTAVGTVFLVAVVIGALSYVTYSMNVLGNFSEYLITEEKRQKDQKTESFEISSLQIDAQSKLDGVVKNTGEIPVKITNLWIEEDGAPDTVKKIPIDRTIAPGKTFNLVDDVDFVMDPLKGYNMKMVTSRGQVQTFAVNSASSGSMWMQLTGVPTTIPSTFETTLFYTVVNNMTNGNNLYNLTPELTANIIGAAVISPIGINPQPTSYPVLGPGEVATFRYTYSLTGEEGDGVTFTAQLQNGVEGNTASTTVMVKEVTLATAAGTALKSFGLANELSATEDIMFFHDDVSLTPNGEYQMDGADPNSAGTTMSPQNGDLIFSSAPMVQASYVAEGGYPWNSTLQYYSHYVSSSVTEPEFAFFFDCDACGGSDDTIESVGLVSNGGQDGDADKEGGSDTPTFFSTGGPFNDGYYNFAGDRMDVSWDPNHASVDQWSNPDACCDSTAAWIRIPPTTDSYMSIIWFGDGSNDSDSYGLSIGNRWSAADVGKAHFHYATEDWDVDITDCESNSRIDDNQWHFIVGVRNAEDNCILYVDGVEQTDKDTTCCDNTTTIDADQIGIGWDHNDANTELTGDIALIMHWNDHVLSQSEVTTLYNTNYGEDATTIQLTIDKTDANGIIIENITTDIIALDFSAPGINSPTSGTNLNFLTSNSTDEKYVEILVKTYIGANVTLVEGEHLLYTLSDVPQSTDLPVFFRMDDNTMSTPSHLHTSPADPNWPTFLILDNDDLITYVAYNEGPNGVWFNYQGTRMVLSTTDGLNSFGAVIKRINQTTVDADQDSIYFPADSYASLEFWQLAQPPRGGTNGPSSQTFVDPGDYSAAVFLSGYDEAGEVFLRSIKLGLIHIVE